MCDLPWLRSGNRGTNPQDNNAARVIKVDRTDG
jgi:hypothetical protein